MSDISNNLFGAIENLVARQIDSTPIDLTITAEIILVKNIEVGEYKVSYKGDTFSAFSLDPLTVYKQGEEVYVLVPKGDFSGKKVILGKAAYNDTVSYSDRQAMSNQWKTRGPNWLANEWYWRNSSGAFRTDNNERKAGIIATTAGEESLIVGPNNAHPSWREYIFVRDADTNPAPDEPPLSVARQNKITRPLATNRPGLNALKQVDEQFQVYSNVFDHVMISANFETNFSNVHFSGEYGILVECWTDNPKYGKANYPSEPERIITTLRFSFNDFNGAPYQFNQVTPQRAVFPVPKGVLKGLVRVCLFQDDGWNTDIVPVYIKPGDILPDSSVATSPDVSFDPAKGAKPVRDRNNIFATNVDIRWCENINLTDSLFWLRIDAPRGTSLYNASGTMPANPSLPLEARLFYGSEELTSAATCKFVWFRQKYSATMDKVNRENDKDEYGRTWWDYGGNGWAPIDKIMASPADEPFFGENANGPNQYSFKDPNWHQTLNVGIDVVPWQWRYKVVCIYNPTAKNIEEKLLRDSREVILFETELITNVSSIHDFELPLPMVSNDLLTTYIRTRNNNLPWEERVAYNPQNPDIPDPAKDWWCRWWMETPSGLYEPVPHSGQPRFQKGKISINDYLHYDAITFKAQIFGKKNPSGATQEAKIADAAQVWAYPAGPNQTQEHNEYEIANVERTLLKSEDLMLLVDWDGITHHSYNSDGSILLESSVGMEFSLRAILHWSDSSIMDYAIEWIAPDGITPLRHHSTYPGGNATGSGFAMEESMMKDMWVGADNIIRYKVNQKYDINKIKNTFTLRVTLIDGRVFEYSKEITFSKAGQNGTQGSEWESRIWPTNENAEVVGSVGFEKYTEEIRLYPRPLVVNGNFNGTGALTRNDNFKLFLRPFIYKNGKRIEELPDADNYSYKVYWDSRYPNVKDATLTDRYLARNGSFLEFIKFNGQPDTNLNGKTPGVVSPVGTQRLQAFTDSLDRVGGGATASRTYGAIEVRWRGVNTAGLGATIAGLKYDFVIKAQVDIYKQGQLIATIFSYWPVDILFTNGATITPANFNPNKIKTNWPQFVMYNPTGYSPEVHQDFLSFYYGDKAWNEFDPLPFTATPVNLTTTIQEVKLSDSASLKSWRLFPRPYYFFEECANGSIRTDLTTSIGEPGWSSPNPDFAGWQQCTYVRPIVYMLNAYGNTDINGWDGKSIDLNDERGTIFAPTIGAGYKNPFTNTFSGVIMGIDTSQSKQLYNSLFGGFSSDDIDKNPFMTGLFGYQNGVSSFGIMENGTAYFGRADRGGRIIIDGYNAQIYGGVNGSMNGGRDMPMANRMRLSFIDFEGVAYDQGIGNTDDRISMETDGIRVNTGSYNVGPTAAPQFQFFRYFANANDQLSVAGRNAGFGSGRGSGTPAIEIGSYKEFIDSGGSGQDLIRNIQPLETQGWYNSIKGLEIPGYRKFLVTYDGTLYAMNAFIKGNIVGSNIVGSNFYNSNGNFGVTENGNMWLGDGANRFSEQFIASAGQWSAIVPTVGAAMTVEDILNSTNADWTSMAPNPIAASEYAQVNAPFFVSSDGRVFCQEVHISGRSSINIGGFHVVPRRAGGNAGDVFSFGTMYLIGPGSGSGTAVEAWGHFYLRGTLTNLGKVFLGASVEKRTGTGAGTATSLNSPFSITPTLTSDLALPVDMGVWPLYFHSKAGALNGAANNSWVTLSSNQTAAAGGNNTYMPAFSRRPAGQTQFHSNAATGDSLATQVVWRVDQLGMWTDATFFTRKDWTGNPSDQTPLNFTTHGLACLGWYKTLGNGSEFWNFGIVNVSNDAPSFFIETPHYVRLSSGHNINLRGTGIGNSVLSRSNGVLMESWWGSGTIRRRSMLVVSSGTATDKDSITGGASTIGFIGRTPGRTDIGPATVETVFFMNGIGGTTNSILVDERNLMLEYTPTYAQGKIWMKAVGIAFDGAVAIGSGSKGVTDPSFQYNSTIRINRSWDGSDASPNMPIEEPTGKNFVGIYSSTIMIKASDTLDGKSMHIVHGLADNNAASSEIYFSPTKDMKLFAPHEVHIGAAGTGHALTAYLKFTPTQVTFVGPYATADNQFAIYARFG